MNQQILSNMANQSQIYGLYLETRLFYVKISFFARTSIKTLKRHPILPVCGIIDCIAYIHGLGWAVIDWKTSQKKKTSLADCWDDPIQVAAYCSILGLNKGVLVKIYE